MMQNIRITILIENKAYKDSLKTEHGLSFWIEHGNDKILFDTGQSDAILHNARILDINLEQIDAIILSHGHYDHAGGLFSVLKIALGANIYLHPAATGSKFSQKTSEAKYIGMSDSAKNAIQSCNVIWTAAPATIFPGMSVTGQVPRKNDYEDTGGAFFADKNCHKPDKLLDDQSLFIESSKGLVIVLGCGHAGVVNTLDYVSNLTGAKNIYSVMGGMHLLNANSARIAKTIEAFKKYQVQKIIPLHCTGREAMERLKITFGDKCLFLGTGGQINF